MPHANPCSPAPAAQGADHPRPSARSRQPPITGHAKKVQQPPVLRPRNRRNLRIHMLRIKPSESPGWPPEPHPLASKTSARFPIVSGSNSFANSATGRLRPMAVLGRKTPRKRRKISVASTDSSHRSGAARNSGSCCELRTAPLSRIAPAIRASMRCSRHASHPPIRAATAPGLARKSARGHPAHIAAGISSATSVLRKLIGRVSAVSGVSALASNTRQ